MAFGKGWILDLAELLTAQARPPYSFQEELRTMLRFITLTLDTRDGESLSTPGSGQAWLVLVDRQGNARQVSSHVADQSLETRQLVREFEVLVRARIAAMRHEDFERTGSAFEAGPVLSSSGSAHKAMLWTRPLQVEGKPIGALCFAGSADHQLLSPHWVALQDVAHLIEDLLQDALAEMRARRVKSRLVHFPLVALAAGRRAPACHSCDLIAA